MDAEHSAGHIRKLYPIDLPLVRDHLLRLDPESRRSRFAMAATDDFVRNYAERSFSLDTVMFGHIEAGELRGLGELRPLPAGRDAEAAFSIERDWRGRHIGSELFAQVVECARNRRMRRIYLSCLAHNRTMQGLARKYEAELEFECGDVLGVLEAPEPTPSSIVGEMVRDISGFATAVLEFPRRLF